MKDESTTYFQVKTVIYGADVHTLTTAQVVFDKAACKIANVDLGEIEKLLLNSSPSKNAFDLGWDECPEIEFKNTRVISQNYSCTQGKFKLFEYSLN